ncbi:MAG: PIG-L deacetylase family protein [Gammaproteobacteria bacterium]
MRRLSLGHFTASPGHVLCLGAHCDDLEIGCAGTVLRLTEEPNPPAITWVVFTSEARREAEALRSAEALLRRASRARIIIHKFRDGFLPYEGSAVKESFEELKNEATPDLVLTHYRHDLHQDHRLISELTWNTFRDHLILEYEIPKYDGDFGVPNLFVPLDESLVRRKVDAIMTGFSSQVGKRWFTEETFRSVLRLRGMECNAPDNYAEAFHCRKLVVG